MRKSKSSSATDSVGIPCEEEYMEQRGTEFGRGMGDIWFHGQFRCRVHSV